MGVRSTPGGRSMGRDGVFPLPFIGLCCFLVACTPLRGPAPIEEWASGSAGPRAADEAIELAPASAPPPATGVAATDQSGMGADVGTSARTVPVQSLLASAMQASARNDWAVAAATLERAIKLAPTDGSLWTQFGLCPLPTWRSHPGAATRAARVDTVVSDADHASRNMAPAREGRMARRRRPCRARGCRRSAATRIASA